MPGGALKGHTNNSIKWHPAPNCMGIKHMNKKCAERGAAVVEFALVLPVLLLVCFGMIEMSVALYDQAVITNASREGARAGIVLRNPKLTTAEIGAVALQYCQSHLITFGARTTPTVTVISSPNPVFSTPLSVTVNYTYSGLGFGALLSSLNAPLTLKATSVMNNE